MQDMEHLHPYSLQVAELASLAQLLPPCSPTVRNPVPDSSLCRAAAPRLRRLQLLLASVCCSPIASVSTAAPRLCPFQLLPDCVPFGCSAAAPRQLFWKIPAMSTILQHSTLSSRFSKLNEVRRSRVTIV